MADAEIYSKGTTGMKFSISVRDVDENENVELDNAHASEQGLIFRRPDGTQIFKDADTIEESGPDAIEWTVDDEEFLGQKGEWLVWARWTMGTSKRESYDRKVFYVV